jgi:hypothetical protein
MSPNSNYLAGVRFERKIMHELNREGYTALRTAGSHGDFDVIGVPRNPDWPVLFVQCKRTEDGNKAKKLLLEFRAHPPQLPSKHYHQRIDISVKNGVRIKATI